MYGFTVKGDCDGKEVALWTSPISGLEIISVDGREVSRKRSLGLRSSHDLSHAGIAADLGVVTGPSSLELRRQGTVVATIGRPPRRALLLLGCFVGIAAGALLWSWVRG